MPGTGIPPVTYLLEEERHISATTYRVNDTIRVPEVRLIGPDGENIGVVSIEEAKRIANEADLDLVEVAPNAEPPVCRVMDFGKFVYERTKKEREARKAQTKVEIKEIRLRPKTGQHDIDFKVKRAKKFLQHKDKVQVTVIFRGREMAHIAEGRRVMDEVIEELADFGKLESAPSQHARRMMCTIAPK